MNKRLTLTQSFNICLHYIYILAGFSMQQWHRVAFQKTKLFFSFVFTSTALHLSISTIYSIFIHFKSLLSAAPTFCLTTFIFSQFIQYLYYICEYIIILLLDFNAAFQNHNFYFKQLLHSLSTWPLETVQVPCMKNHWQPIVSLSSWS